MKIDELRQKYIYFFISRDHKQIPGASLIPENDPTVLFTTAGMHPLIPYLLGEKHPSGKRLTNIQKCIRTGDIDEVGDDWHLTFFEMLGNWSLGDYFKEEAIKMSFDFLTKELNISKDKLAVTCFEGDSKNNISKDIEATDAWKSVGISEKRIAFLGYKDNWWGPAGQIGPCGPDTEMFYWTGESPAPVEFDPYDKRWVEIWNDVFMQYYKNKEKKYQTLDQKNVDTGMGLERTTAILNGKTSVYQIDPLKSIVNQIQLLTDESDIRAKRIIADHIRASVFILAEGVEPSNTEHGYILRRLIRRSIRFGRQLKISGLFTDKIAETVIDKMKEFYPELHQNKSFIISQLQKEESKFDKTLEKGLKEFSKMKIDNLVSAEEAFKLFATYGFPLEMIKELAYEKNIKVDEKGFNEKMLQHQKNSRKGAEKKFKGGLADDSEATARLHTVAHLVLAALRKVLGEHVYQRGSNITSERLRFDFSHNEKMTDDQKKQVEDLVNEQINKDLPIICQEMELTGAKAQGAMGIFDNKYGQKVKVYTIGDFSKEICGGPHAKKTGELGRFRIKKEESSSSGVRRIKGVLE